MLIKLPQFGIKSLFIAISIIAIAIALFHRSPTTVRHSFGEIGGISTGIITCGDRVDVLASEPDGDFEVVAENLMVANEMRLQMENGEFVVYIDVYASIWQQYTLRRCQNLKIEPRFEIE